MIHCLMLLDEVNCRATSRAEQSRLQAQLVLYCSVGSRLSGVDESPGFFSFPRTETQEDLQKLPPGFPRGAVPQPPFPPLSPTMAQMHTLMPAQSLQPTQQLEYKVRCFGLVGLVYPSVRFAALVWAGLQGAAASAEHLRVPGKVESLSVVV